MRTLLAFLKLIRLPNLFMMAFTMYSVRHFIILPILQFSGSDTQLSHAIFSMIVVSVLLIAASGYIINDYYDIEIDSINKPDRMILGKKIQPARAYYLFHIMGICGILLAFYIGSFGRIPFIGIIHLGCFFLLWGYAAYFKKMILVGNLTVSLLSALTILLPVIYDEPARMAEPILLLAGGYFVFAFLISFVRELLKDLEDLPGDLAGGCKTLPVLAGPKVSKWVALLLISLTTVLLVWVQWQQFQSEEWVSFSYVTFLLTAPILYLFYRTWRSSDISHFHFCSSLSKFIMLSGIISMMIFHLSFK